MEPRIQFAKTSDGVNIAYTARGTGRPLIAPPVPPFGSLSSAFDSYLWSPLRERFRVLTYDARGTGFSERESLDFSMDAMHRDLEAVAADAAFDAFGLVAFVDAVPIAITYAATHPGQVSHLVVIDGWLQFSDYADSAAYKIEVSLRDKDWELFTETFAQVLWQFDDPALAREMGRWLRASCSPDAWRASQTAFESYDAAPAARIVNVPTLVIQNRINRWVPVRSGQRIAASIRGARLALIDDMTYACIPPMIADFAGDAGAAQATKELPSGTAIILFADIVDSTALTEHLGDVAFRAKARDLDGALRTAIREHGGTPIEGKTLGDGVLAVFTSAKQAIACAQACHNAATEAGLSLHAGIHAGDVIREADNVYGGAVNIAARVAAASAAGETLVSATVRELARTSAGVVFEDRGEQALKGIGETVRVWAVRQA